MKKIISLFLVLVISISALAIATAEDKTRYLVKSKDDNLKSGKDVHHDFDNGFTADLSKKEVNELRSNGVEVEAVPLRHITAKPGASSCNPTEEFPWGVRMVNGGTGGDGVTVAVLDTGLKTDHPDLAAGCVPRHAPVRRFPRSGGNAVYPPGLLEARPALCVGASAFVPRGALRALSRTRIA